jgi:hypothetical protein
MAVRIGKIDLVGLTNVSTEDTRAVVQQRGPGQSGSVAQDLGREPVTVVLEGTLFGDAAEPALEELRDAQTKAKPLAFAADAIAGTELTDVIIADFQVKQLPGFQSKYSFFLRVREHTEPPEAEGAAADAVNQQAAADAAASNQNSLDAAGVVQNPDALMATVETNPAALAQLSPNELGSVLDKSKGKLSGKNFSTILGALGKLDPSLITDLIGVIQGNGSLGDFIQKLASEGINLIKDLTGIDLGAALDIIKGLQGATDFLAKLQKVVKDATALGETIGSFDPLGAYNDVNEGP